LSLQGMSLCFDAILHCRQRNRPSNEGNSHHSGEPKNLRVHDELENWKLKEAMLMDKVSEKRCGIELRVGEAE
jgi:hypothetical protein